MTNVRATLGPPRIVPPGAPQTYLGVAHSMAKGVRALADAAPSSPLALALVAAHVLECSLKAYLSRAGDDSAARKIGHNIDALWSMAHDKGLDIPSGMPGWAATLNHIHGHPYFLRYSTGIHGLSVPSAEPMATELQELLDLIQRTIEQAPAR